MSEHFAPLRARTHQVREFTWLFDGPGLLSHEVFGASIESDEALRARIEPHRERLLSLDESPAPLLEFLAATEMHNRLGRYFETLLRFYLLCMARVEKLESNLQIRSGRQTLGELDHVFRETLDATPIHWEASVKFYLCTTSDPERARELRFFMGTLEEDRFDRKLAKFLDRQLKLPLTPEASARLSELGLADPSSRALLRGFLYYPAEVDWRHHPHPPEVSSRHSRGWWTNAKSFAVPQRDSTSRYILLPPARWMAPFEGLVARDTVHTLETLRDLTRAHFDGPETWGTLHREMMIAEVEVTNESHEGAWVRELTRGNILHEGWIPIARAEAERPLAAPVAKRF